MVKKRSSCTRPVHPHGELGQTQRRGELQKALVSTQPLLRKPQNVISLPTSGLRVKAAKERSSKSFEIQACRGLLELALPWEAMGIRENITGSSSLLLCVKLLAS